MCKSLGNLANEVPVFRQLVDNYDGELDRLCRDIDAVHGYVFADSGIGSSCGVNPLVNVFST